MEPNRQKTEELLLKLHCEGIPHWTTQDTQEAYQQLKVLYEHWFRRELNETQNSK